ncbi:UNVERIFIED_CONTAM: putative bacteriocin precursor [Acetivibrio alkalicellulosi]
MKKLGKKIKSTKLTVEAYDGMCICFCNCNCGGNQGVAMIQIRNGVGNSNKSRYGRK